MLYVKDIMHTAYRVEPSQTIADVARIMIAHDLESVLVVDDHELLGIVTQKDLLRAVLPTGAELCEADRLMPFKDLVAVANDHFATSVESVMSRPVQTIGADSCLVRALGIMLLGRIRRLPVLGPSGEVIGIMTEPDLFRAVFMEGQHADRMVG